MLPNRSTFWFGEIFVVLRKKLLKPTKNFEENQNTFIAKVEMLFLSFIFSFQHIVIRTAKPIHLRAGDWVTNGVGKNVSHSFGYGLMDAGAMVRLARNWTNVLPQRRCRQHYPSRFKYELL